MIKDLENIDVDWQMPCCPQPPDWRLDWHTVLDTFGWLVPLQDCRQDPIWHAEGDVLTHTRMVCEALIESTEWQSLPSIARSIVFAAALFHDVAKPLVTQEIDGRVRAPKHAAKGSYIARQLLYQKLLPTLSAEHVHIREQICDLVLHHGLPLYEEYDQPEARQTLIRVSQYCRFDWLAILAEADVRGRTCEDRQSMLERIELFREFCRELNCFGHPRLFPNGSTRFLYLNGKWDDPDSAAFENWKSDVILMAGLPGAGKDTWISSRHPDLQVISLDRIRTQLKLDATDNQGPVISKAKDEALALLRKGTPFIWNATNVTREMRGRLIGLFSRYHANVRVQYIESPWSQLIAQNRKRDQSVPERVINKLVASLQPPRCIEANEVNYHASVAN